MPQNNCYRRFPLIFVLTFAVIALSGSSTFAGTIPVFKLSGPVDTSIKASYAVTPWALVSVGANVPTGNGTHSGQEAIVASVLSTDLLGFREATWGTGFAVTSSVASARVISHGCDQPLPNGPRMCLCEIVFQNSRPTVSGRPGAAATASVAPVNAGERLNPSACRISNLSSASKSRTRCPNRPK